MVSVILLILKILGLILLGILGLVLLLILTVLLVPIRFEVRGSLQESKPEGRAVVSWLAHILSACAVYDGDLNVSIRIFGFRLGQHDEDTAEKKRKRNGRKKKKRPEKKQKPAKKESRQNPEMQQEKVEAIEEAEAIGEAEAIEEAEVIEEAEAIREAEEMKAAEDAEEAKTLFPFWRICDKLKSGFQRICVKLRALWQRLMGLKEKKEQVQAFFQDEANRATIKLAKRQVFKLVKHVLPRKMKGRIRFGFEDPYTTGQILTYVSPFYGWYAGKVELIPVFEEAVLEGNLQLKGRVRIGTVLTIAGRMLLDKNFRKLLKKFRAA